MISFDIPEWVRTAAVTAAVLLPLVILVCVKLEERIPKHRTNLITVAKAVNNLFTVIAVISMLTLMAFINK